MPSKARRVKAAQKKVDDGEATFNDWWLAQLQGKTIVNEWVDGAIKDIAYKAWQAATTQADYRRTDAIEHNRDY